MGSVEGMGERDVYHRTINDLLKVVIAQMCFFMKTLGEHDKEKESLPDYNKLVLNESQSKSHTMGK